MFQFSSVAQSCPTLCDPMDCSTPGFAVYHQLLELAQTQVHWVGDAIQPSHPVSSPSLLLSIFPSIRGFASGGQSIGVSASASVLPVNIHDWFPLGLTGWSPCYPRDSQESSPTPQFRKMLTSTNEYGQLPSSSIFWMNLTKIGITSSLIQFTSEAIWFWASLRSKVFDY